MKSTKSFAGRALVVLLLVGIGACTQVESPEGAESAAANGAPECKVDAFPAIPDLTISSAVHEDSPAPHCRVVGVIGTEIGFELRLPDDWNGKFIMGGGGGFAGNFNNAAQDMLNVVGDGWATVSTDTGHKGNALVATWALNNLERQVNFGHQAVHRTAVNAKALIEAYFGSEIERNLFYGCSRGGGQALMLAQRSPELFDGIYAGAPAISWTRELGARWAWNAQHMYPDINQISRPVIDPGAVALIGNAVLEQCDGLDGLEDGILNDPRQCDFEVASLACEEGSSGQCLTSEQVAVAEAMYADVEIGGVMTRGVPLGAEMPGNPLGWALWITGGYTPGRDMEFHPGDDNDEAVFADPVVPSPRWAFAIGMMRNFIFSDPEWSYEGYDWSDYAEQSASVAQSLDADSPDLSSFRTRGGKLIIDNGWMDGSMSPHGTIDYYESVIDFDPSARDDVRLFVRPGVAHCLGGPGPDGTNYIAALEEWLDSGVAPEQLDAPYVTMALGRPPSGQGGRIICAHPSIVTYDGSGDPNDPASFSCTVPD